jgi:hypothetical protein
MAMTAMTATMATAAMMTPFGDKDNEVQAMTVTTTTMEGGGHPQSRRRKHGGGGGRHPQDAAIALTATL